MYIINKLISTSAVDYAAEELKKYLRMMMPEGGDVTIAFAPDATDGFRLGLMQDFGLDLSDVDNAELDDVIYIDCDEKGGIIAGSNPRSVLIAVYEYLRQNGCRWLFPGVDGEYIPTRDIVAVKYRHRAASRIRGNCLEGTPSQRNLCEFVDFMPKVGLNTFMIQFRVPGHFYRRRYEHRDNSMNFAPELLSDAQNTKWTVQIECEIARRGLVLHSYGHGFTTDPFGIDSSIGWAVKSSADYPADVINNFAMLNGKRDFYGGKPLNTQICMSNPNIRKKVAEYVADYALRHSNIDYLHIWLADGSNNHCECDECKKMRPSDYYVRLLNEVDEALAAANSNMRIILIAYVDTLWAPIVEKIKNPDRFTIMIAPITRDYNRGYDPDAQTPAISEYVRNKLVMPTSLEENIAYFKQWDPAFSGDSFVFEYHFWKPQHYDLSGQVIAKRIYDDIISYRDLGFDGIVECGSQRSFFPNGLAFYTHARALYDGKVSFDELLDDYYSHAYGENYKKFEKALAALSDALDYEYVSYPCAIKRAERYATADAAKNIAAARDAKEKLAALIAENYNSDERIITASTRVLEYYCNYLDHFILLLEKKSLLDNEGAAVVVDEFKKYIGSVEPLIDTFYDHAQAFNAIGNHILKA